MSSGFLDGRSLARSASHALQLSLLVLVLLTGRLEQARAQVQGSSAPPAIARPYLHPWITKSQLAIDPDVQASTALFVEPSGLCSASLIADHLAVTAAHCVLSDGPRFLQFKSFSALDSATTRLNVDAVELTPAFDETKLDTLPRLQDLEDIALLHFSDPLPSGFRPSRLAPAGFLPPNGANLILAGFGVMDPLTETGAGTLREVQSTLLDGQYAPTEIKIDASHGGSCYGDSGGPAYLRANNSLYLIAIDNWGEGPCDDYSIYALISSHLGWITKIAAKYGAKLAN